MANLKRCAHNFHANYLTGYWGVTLGSKWKLRSEYRPERAKTTDWPKLLGHNLPNGARICDRCARKAREFSHLALPEKLEEWLCVLSTLVQGSLKKLKPQELKNMSREVLPTQTELPTLAHDESPQSDEAEICDEEVEKQNDEGAEESHVVPSRAERVLHNRRETSPNRGGTNAEMRVSTKGILKAKRLAEEANLLLTLARRPTQKRRKTSEADSNGLLVGQLLPKHTA
eukprot:NODE_1510_length_879_cov_255.777108_g1169_i0.p1 GENE.NODE_1510_length_879_cov_255.777108_g1169_i0~~NODE_1510_length_879_cov_255.777108_g1169_i0.p1  ORF type:complete len:229 (+),score=22.19 NODE_1510_length_879_cov_255.777108_g1169_i0:58-744(+)